MLDILSLGILILFSVVGFFRGAIKEVLLFLSLIASIVCALRYNILLLDNFGIGANFISIIVVGFVIMFVVNLLINICIGVLCLYIKGIRLGIVDRTLGMLIGYGKSIIIIFVIMLSVDIVYNAITPKKCDEPSSHDCEVEIPNFLVDSIAFQTFLWMNESISRVVPGFVFLEIQHIGDMITTSLERNVTRKETEEQP
ncbi:MAG: colicin V production family protein [Candidatus Xenolissoclinum pacificiensis L6]|uniref:Colicin V production family protein n=1 Tax=Candidatus Xenolissoclinum pacificiensis L6 TaxID=1401685 RepID=W2UZ66_9RICK|nr:MAG: colicin V production family protein [Candidatus Xenolissoclinum pacificiensis L6]